MSALERSVRPGERPRWIPVIWTFTTRANMHCPQSRIPPNTITGIPQQRFLSLSGGCASQFYIYTELI